MAIGAMSSMSAYVVMGVGGVECLRGAYALFFPEQALAVAVGRLLSVGAASSSPALLPTLTQNGALRLGMGVLILMVGMSTHGPAFHSLEAAIVAHACLLQPLALACRSSSRMPVHNTLLIGLIEGVALIGGMAADFDFDLNTLLDSPYIQAAIAFLMLGVLLALITTMKVCRGAKVGDEMEKSPVGSEPLLFDANRLKLSPAAKKLLA